VATLSPLTEPNFRAAITATVSLAKTGNAPPAELPSKSCLPGFSIRAISNPAI
jgi:hypothetical protein